MPPKAKISKEMIVNAALEIARLTGAENINARTVSQKLNCSTQPIMYRFLFQSNSFSGKSIVELINDEALEPILTIFSQGIQIDMIKTKEIFRILFLFVHGYASMLANNTISFDEKSITNDLELVLDGAICMKQKGAK